MLIWKDDYAIGVELIDEQHKHLFQIGNSIYALLEDKVLVDKYDKIVTILQDLKQYTKYHFQTEEEYMLQNRYPKFFSHKVEHDDFINKIEEVELKDIDVDQENYIREILVFVFNWILEHILKNDKLITAKE
ncbi:MAG: hemerythrin family protein [Peptococcaceae bacterium]|nr:hemerythrin family protein [Peptococcaceae bacterium]